MCAMHEAHILHKYNYATLDGSKLFFEEFQNKIPWNQNELILDIGCGTGEVTNKLLSKFAPPNSKIIGMDISEEMISFAKAHHKNGQITYMTGDITDDLHLLMHKELFTKIASFFTLYRIKDNRKAYQNMYHLLKPQGEVMLTIPTVHDCDQIPPYLAKLPKYSKYAEQLSKMKVNVWPCDDHKSYTEDLLNECGFEVVCCELKRWSHRVDSVHDFTEIFGFVSPLRNLLPKIMFEEALADAKIIVEENNLLIEKEVGYKLFMDTLFILAKKK